MPASCYNSQTDFFKVSRHSEVRIHLLGILNEGEMAGMRVFKIAGILISTKGARRV
jgi:hypothetical protein